MEINLVRTQTRKAARVWAERFLSQSQVAENMDFARLKTELNTLQ
jgi:hypothetical protein